MTVLPDDLAAIIYTSGTTGTAKGVMLTHRNLCMNCVGGIRNQHFHTKTIVLLPLHHTFAILGLMCTLMNGCHEYIGSLKNISKDIKEQRPYSLILVPMIVEAFYKTIWNTAEENGKDGALRKLISISNFLLRLGIDLRKRLFKSVRNGFGGNLELVISGGAPLDKECIKDLRAFGIQIAEGYGITECAPLVAVNRIQHFRDGSVGLPIFNANVKIADDGNKEGEICVKGECVFKGYLNAPELTAEAFDEDGYFKTGDVGYIDEDGFVYVTGRVKNMIVLANGKNVYPEELEFELMKNKAVKEVLVYEKDKAIVAEVFPDAEYINANAITDTEKYFADTLDTLNRTLPLYKNINKIILRDTEFPKTTSMKIKRKYNS